MAWSEDTKKRFSESRKGSNNPFFGRKHTEEAKNKVRDSKLGIARSEETKKKLSEWHKGTKLSEETKKAIGLGGLGKKHTEETKLKMRNPNLTDEQREKYKRYRFFQKEHIAWSKAVKERDDYTCDICGRKVKNIFSHHLLKYSKHLSDRYDVNNGITICFKHHAKQSNIGFHKIYGIHKENPMDYILYKIIEGNNSSIRGDYLEQYNKDKEFNLIKTGN